jgi:endonuclease/exonuclease/phosphatase family metal-dependent hydrolase
MTLYSWNSLGKPDLGEKSKFIQNLVASVQGPQLVFIQEGGSGFKADGGMTTFCGVSVGAKNDRCTNYLLTKLDGVAAAPRDVTLKDGDKAVITGGVAGRTPAAAEIGRTLLISWHATSYVGTSDAEPLIALLQKGRGFEKYEMIVVGGDFNATPDQLQPVADRVRAASNFTLKLIQPREATYRSKNSKLDYFLIFYRDRQKDKVKLPATADVIKNVLSDHYPIAIQMPLLI